MNDILNHYLNASREEIEALGIHALKQLTLAILTKQNKELDYNAINRRSFELRDLPFHLARQTLESENLFNKFPPPPRPYRSWAEVWCFTFSPLKNTVHESKESFVTYYTKHTYKPDTVINGVLIEIKGCFSNLQEARKYLTIQAQTDQPILFVLQNDNTQLPYTKPRKDGSRMTMEEWLDANGFPFCYMRDLDTYLQSKAFSQLSYRDFSAVA
ncbi:hypothetical protein AB3A32_002630 [Vibrio alginolyticus]